MAFYTPIASSAPHVYLSALPLSPTDSMVWMKTNRLFQNLLKMTEGRQTSWRGCPLEWHGHGDRVVSVVYSLDGSRIISGSEDHTIRIWDAQMGQAVVKP